MKRNLFTLLLVLFCVAATASTALGFRGPYNSAAYVGQPTISNLMIENGLYVDGNRTDSYTADGGLLRPYKTLLAALAVVNVDVGKSWTIYVAPGTYADNLTITGPRHLKIQGTGGVVISGTILINSGVGSYDRIEFVGTEGGRAEKGPALTISGKITATRANDSLIYVGFHGCYITGQFEATTSGTWVLQYSNCRVNGAITGTFDGTDPDERILIEAHGFNEFVGAITGKTSLYNCNGADIYSNIDTTPWYENRFTHCTFGGSVSIIPQAGASSVVTYLDSISYKSLKARTPTLTGVTLSHTDGGVMTGETTEMLVGGGDGNNPVWTTATGTLAPVRSDSPEFTTKITTPAVVGPTSTILAFKPATDAVNAVQIQDKDGNAITTWDTVNNKIISTQQAVTNAHHYLYSPAVFTSTDGWVQIVAADSGNGAAGFLLTNSPATGDNKHWLIHHKGPGAGNYLAFAYGVSAASGDFSPAIGEKVAITTTGLVGLGTTTPDTRLHAELDDATTSAAKEVARLTLTSTGTPAAGIGPALQFETETAAGSPGNMEVVAQIDGVATTVTGAAEQGALVLKTMTGGAAAAERMRVDGTNVGLGQTTFGTSAAKVLAMGSGTAPTTSPADATQLWSADHNSAAGYARLYQRTEDGLSGPVAQLAEVTQSVNPKAMAQGVNMTAAASGSSGITVADDDDIDFGTGDFTLVWRGSLPDWTPSDSARLIHKIPSGTVGYYFFIEDTGKIRLNINNTNYDSTVATGFVDGTTHLLTGVVTRESASTAGSVVFYIDGKQLGSSVPITLGAPSTVNNALTLYINGNDTVRTASTTQFAATYNRAMTAAEVRSLYENGVDYADKYGSQSELMPNQVDRDFSGASAWANVDINAYDETDDLTITASAAAQYCTLVAASAPMVYGKKYRVTFDVANLVGTWTVKDFSGTITLGTVSADGAQSFEFTNTGASVTGGFRLIAVADTSSGDFDNFTLKQIGATLALEPEGIRNDRWQDSSTNGLNGSYPTTGSSLVRPIPTSNGAILLSATTVSLAADADTAIYTVPTGKRCVLSHAVLVAGADAVSTDVSIGANGAETDFIGPYQCDNLDAENDAIIIAPVPNSTPVKIKSYAGGTVIDIKVENHAGGATNTLYLFGFLY